jgi:hypothetical protein
VVGVLGDVGQFVVERCDQKELVTYFWILHFTRDSANGLRFMSVIQSGFLWQRGIHGIFTSICVGHARLAEHFCRRGSGRRSEAV